MRANIPRTPPRPSIGELEGTYLQAMQEISVRLMEGLPASDELWQTLGQVETMLLEAQLREMPLNELFGSGGIAAFCQSIIDEFAEEKKNFVPAAKEKTLRSGSKHNSPRGGINYVRKRRFTAVLASFFALALTLATLWYTGILHYWKTGSGFYLDELYNFAGTYEATNAEPMAVTLPLNPFSGMSQVLYTDEEGYDITLTALETYEHAGGFTDPETGEVIYQKMVSWYLRLTYTVDADFRKVTYVEPASTGTVTVRLANGDVHTGKITWIESGKAEQGREYARISVIDLPYVMNTEGAVLEVRLDPPIHVEWNRISMGRR